MIEPCWPHIKRVTTRKGAPQQREVARKVWQAAWRDLEQWRIQAWIERIMRHIEKVIELKGGNEYREGAIEVPRRLKAPKAVENEWEDI